MTISSRQFAQASNKLILILTVLSLALIGRVGPASAEEPMQDDPAQQGMLYDDASFFDTTSEELTADGGEIVDSSEGGEFAEAGIWYCTVMNDPPTYTITSGGVKYINGYGTQSCGGDFKQQRVCNRIQRFNAGTGKWVDQPNGAGNTVQCSTTTSKQWSDVKMQVKCGTKGKTYSFRTVTQGRVKPGLVWIHSKWMASASRYTKC